MNKVTVKLLIPLPGFPREREISIDFFGKMTVLQLLDEIAVRYGEKLKEMIYDRESGSIRLPFGIFVNGTHINFLKGFQTMLKNNDTIIFFLTIGGG